MIDTKAWLRSMHTIKHISRLFERNVLITNAVEIKLGKGDAKVHKMHSNF